jgi:hypothetical protein
MSTFTESKPWEEVDPTTGTLNQNSYAATAVWGLVELAVETLHANDLPITPTNVRAMSRILTGICADVQKTLRPDSSVALQEGSHQRVRGAVRTALSTLPQPPFGQDNAAWIAWVDKVTKRTIGIARIANELWQDAGSAGAAWAPFLPETTETAPAAA